MVGSLVVWLFGWWWWWRRSVWWTHGRREIKGDGEDVRNPIAVLWGWWLGRKLSKLRRVVDIGRRREKAGDGGSLLLLECRASTDEQETLGATGSNRKQQDVAAAYFPTTNLGGSA